jgi:mannose-6-phosphate isomerase
MTASGVLTFAPIFMERVWGGRRLETTLAKPLPPDAVVGESWEIVDRPEAQSVVQDGPLAGRTLGELWAGPDRARLFGSRATAAGDRFPLLVKVLDCEDVLSVQVHPPAAVAATLGGEPKTEMWVIADAKPGAEVLAGLRAGVTREAFERALRAGEDVSSLLHAIPVAAGDVMYLPSGRVHAIGAGNLIVEIQQNSDTTYRVYDFGRTGLDGRPRELHVDASLASIDWDDVEPGLVPPNGDALVHCDVLAVDRWRLDAPRRATDPGECAIVCCLTGTVTVGGVPLVPGAFAFAPADAVDPVVHPDGDATVLRIALP